MTNWNGTPISYDLNGNMLSDGANTFTWNARNQVATLNSVSLQYDGFGRRTKNLQNTSFFFDGPNAVQELSGSTATANLINGSIDEIFTRADSTGAFTPLKDALGSTIALVDAAGNLVTQYAYDPFGNTTVSGATNTNAFQYTGRENEGDGLYFYRARYYSPLLGRFINEDPLGFAGSGPNFYAYVGDNPIDFSDPFGLARGDLWDPRSYYTDGWTTLRDFGTAAEAFTDAITFGSASRLNDALGANVAVDRCGIGHKLGSAAGFVASIAIGGEGLPNALKGLSIKTKQAIGEGLSDVENTLAGSTRVGAQVPASQLGLEGLTTTFDSVWQSAGKGLYYVESKFGTSPLRPAQELAQAVLGSAYHVERWGYPFFARVGGYLGAGWGAAGVMSGRGCGCH